MDGSDRTVIRERPTAVDVARSHVPTAEPKSLGRHAHDREHGDRIHLHAAYAVANRMFVVAPVDVGHGQPVIKKAEIELPMLEHPSDVPVIVRRPTVGS